MEHLIIRKFFGNIFFYFEQQNWIFLSFRILAINNSRKFYGTTYINTNESNDPLVQFINLKDGSQRDDIYQVNFTNEELDSNEIFCRRTTKTIQRKHLIFFIMKSLNFFNRLVEIMRFWTIYRNWTPWSASNCKYQLKCA